MAKWVIDSDTLTGIADAVRDQLGTEDTIKVSEIAEKIAEIEGGGELGEWTVCSCTTADQDSLTFDSGFEPTFFCFFPSKVSDIVGALSYKLLSFSNGIPIISVAPIATGSNKAVRVSTNATPTVEVTEDGTVTFANPSPTYHFATGVEYIGIFQ